MTEESTRYLESEWNIFLRDTVRQEASHRLSSAVDARHVLDIGCGAGQELRPFAAAGATAIGLDVLSGYATVARRLYGRYSPGLAVHFIEGCAEQLPFASASFDVIICRVALPYTDNARALSEMARVLRPEGLILLKIHHLRYYVRKFWLGLTQRQLLSSVHSLRVISSGMLYQISGRQFRNRIVTGETYQTLGMLRRELRRWDLCVLRELQDTNPLTPSIAIGKSGIERFARGTSQAC